MVSKLTPASFEEKGLLLKSKKPTFVMFYMDWCGYCNNLKPVWNELAKSVAICQIAMYNCDTYPQHFSQINANGEIRGYPTLIMFKEGKPVGMYQGERTLKDLIDWCMTMCGGSTPKVIATSSRSKSGPRGCRGGKCTR